MQLSQRILEYLHRDDGELIALHGDARLVRHVNGRYELRGVTPEDRAHIREWCSLFLHEAVFTVPRISRHVKPAEQSCPSFQIVLSPAKPCIKLGC